MRSLCMEIFLFQSTLPVWGATLSTCRRWKWHRFQSTLPVWGATNGGVGLPLGSGISIHAPRVGSDAYYAYSTTDTDDFNPRSPCGERRPRSTAGTSCPLISIHAPRVGSDTGGCISRLIRWHFNPRSPCGERRRLRSGFRFFQHHFNPRSPCGERHSGFGSCKISPTFQSTLPVWGATAGRGRPWKRPCDFNPRSPCGERRHDAAQVLVNNIISIHAPRVGSDSKDA